MRWLDSIFHLGIDPQLLPDEQGNPQPRAAATSSTTSSNTKSTGSLTPVSVDLAIAVNVIAFTFIIASGGFALFTRLLVSLELLLDPLPGFFESLYATPALFVAVLWLSHVGNFSAARVLVLTSVHGTALAWSLLFGPVAHFHHFSFSYLLMPVLFFEKNRRGLVAISSAVPLLNYVIVELAESKYLSHVYRPLVTTPPLPALCLWVAAGLTTTVILTLSAFLLQTQYEHQVANLRRVSEAKAEFLQSMSHEVRTPMNSIIGLTDLLLHSQVVRDAELRQFLKIIHSSGETLLCVVDDVLDLAKIEAGKLSISPGEVNLREFVEEIVVILAPGADARGLELIVDVDGRIDFGAHVFVDGLRLRQILNNLLANAIKFTERGEVLLKVRKVKSRRRLSGTLQPSRQNSHGPQEEFLRFEIQDTGIGIPSQDLPFLFSDFYQVEQRTKRFGGTGLGLAICKHLVHQMGGEIGVISDHGVGSTFWFSIPCPLVTQSESEGGVALGLPFEQHMSSLDGRSVWLYHPCATLVDTTEKFLVNRGMRVTILQSTAPLRDLCESTTDDPPDFLIAPFAALREAKPVSATAAVAAGASESSSGFPSSVHRVALIPWSKQMSFSREVASSYVSLPLSEQ